MRAWSQDDWARALKTLRWTRVAGWLIVILAAFSTATCLLVGLAMIGGSIFQSTDLPPTPIPFAVLGAVYAVFGLICLVATVLTWRCTSATGRLLRQPTTQGLALVLRRYRSWWSMAGIVSIISCIFGLVSWGFSLFAVLG